MSDFNAATATPAAIDSGAAGRSIWRVIPLPLRRILFRLLETISQWYNTPPALPVATSRQGSNRVAGNSTPSLWIFVSTIGELNAIDPLIERLLEEMGQPALTLVSDREQYSAAYATRYPQATRVTLCGTVPEVDALIRARPPLMLLVAEIPSLLHDAPCRLSFATIDAVRRSGAPVVLVNGWIYGYRPPSRLDLIENRLFGRDYVRAFDLAIVQTETIRMELMRAGADRGRVVVAGNIKFDAMLQTRSRQKPSPLADTLLNRGNAPVIVAGSVTETDSQRAVLQAFIRVLAVKPSALLILAPRHPENVERMAALHAMLRELSVPFRLRSECTPDEVVPGSVLVLDTMGELQHTYRAATLAFVGIDHNVLEPLAYGCPVFVCSGWNATYPSYSVYRQLLDVGALHQVESLDLLGDAWVAFVTQDPDERSRRGQSEAELLKQAGGAVERSMEAIRTLGPLRRRGAAL